MWVSSCCMAGDLLRLSLLVRRRHAVARHRAVVVEPHELDHFADVVLVLDPACAWPLPSGEDRVVHDPALREQLSPDIFGKGEVGGVVAVQVTDLAASELEREFAAAARAR